MHVSPRSSRRLARRSLARLRDQDLALQAAGLTFYAGVALVPSLLVAVWGAALLVGRDRVADLVGSLAEALPDELGAPAVATDLAERAIDLSLLTAALALLPATLYGEGLRRALGAQADHQERLTGWRGRLAVVPVLAAAPLMVLALLLVAPAVADLLDGGGAGRTLLGIWLAFIVDWLLVSTLLTYVYAVVAPVRIPVRLALPAALVTGSFVAGFAEGFVLFLALPLDLGAPFGGSTMLGAAVAVLLWLWLLHCLVLIGYAVALAAPGRSRAAGTAQGSTDSDASTERDASSLSA